MEEPSLDDGDSERPKGKFAEAHLGHSPVLISPAATTQTLTSQRLPPEQHLFPLLRLNNQVSKPGGAFLPREGHSLPRSAQGVGRQ